MKGRTKKERRAIGKLVRWIHKAKKRGCDRFDYNEGMKRVIAYKSADLRVGELLYKEAVAKEAEKRIEFLEQENEKLRRLTNDLSIDIKMLEASIRRREH